MSYSFGTSEQKQGSKTKSNPWAPTIPYLEDFLKTTGDVSKANPAGVTADQKTAFGQLEANALEGSPWVDQQKQLTASLYGGGPDRTGMVSDAYSGLQSQLGGYASGQYLDPMSNPQMQAMLQQVGDDAFNRINAQFAGAGRDLSGANQMAAARGVTQAQLPLLLDQYNRAQSQQFDAAKTLYGAGASTADVLSAMDKQRFALQGQAAAAGQTATDQQNQGANAILDLEQQQKMMPYEDLGALASLLFPAAQLGKQEKSSGRVAGSSHGFGLSLGGK
jgi:hypothetical protein